MSANSEEMEYYLEPDQLADQALVLNHLSGGERQTGFEILYDSIEKHYDKGTAIMARQRMESQGYEQVAEFVNRLNESTSNREDLVADGGTDIGNSEDYFSTWYNSEGSQNSTKRSLDSFQG